MSSPAMSKVIRLRSQIEAALDQRGRHYAAFVSFTVRFEQDDTNAVNDAANFQAILKLLGLPPAEELIILGNDKTAAWTCTHWMVNLIHSQKSATGRTLVIGHYAGHGSIDATDQLSLVASPSSPSKMSFLHTLGLVFQSGYIPPETDACIILDACYSGIATRGVDSESWSGELIAAVGPAQKALENWSYTARIQNRTFTSRVAEEVAHEVGQGAASISLAAIVEALRLKSNAARIPMYQQKAGKFGIRIPNLKNVPLPPHRPTLSLHQRRQAALSSPASISSGSSSTIGPSQPSLQASTATPDLSAVFQVHLKTVDPLGSEAQKLLDWIFSLSPNLGIELLGVFKTQSTTILIQAPWVLWAHLNGLDPFELVCEPIGRNLLSRLMN